MEGYEPVHWGIPIITQGLVLPNDTPTGYADGLVEEGDLRILSVLWIPPRTGC